MYLVKIGDFGLSEKLKFNDDKIIKNNISGTL